MFQSLQIEHSYCNMKVEFDNDRACNITLAIFAIVCIGAALVIRYLYYN